MYIISNQLWCIVQDILCVCVCVCLCVGHFFVVHTYHWQDHLSANDHAFPSYWEKGVHM